MPYLVTKNLGEGMKPLLKVGKTFGLKNIYI